MVKRNSTCHPKLSTALEGFLGKVSQKKENEISGFLTGLFQGMSKSKERCKYLFEIILQLNN